MFFLFLILILIDASQPVRALSHASYTESLKC